jgi:hypothetical protein
MKNAFVAHPAASKFSSSNDGRSYDRSIAGLGTSRAPRYFASDFDRSNGIARIICRSKYHFGGLSLRKFNESNMLDRRFAIAPMMEWTDRTEKQKRISA